MNDSKIKLFQSILSDYKTLGIYPTENGETVRLNGRNYFFLLYMFQFLVAMSAHSLFKTQSMAEYPFMFCVCIGMLLVFVVYSIQIWMTNKIFKLIESFESFIASSESFEWIAYFDELLSTKVLNRFLGIQFDKTTEITYNQLNKQIERMSRLIKILVLKLSGSSVMVLPLMLTLVNYFVFNLGSKSFFLPFPIMYVNFRKDNFNRKVKESKKILYWNISKVAIRLGHTTRLFRHFYFWMCWSVYVNRMFYPND